MVLLDLGRRARAPSAMLAEWATAPLAWALLATAVLLVATLAGPGPSLLAWLGDTDDALRLVSVRELLAGAPWFDTTLPRMGAPEPLISHWSRLIDAPLALLLAILTPLTGAGTAELVMRAAWPLLLYAALAIIVAREANRQAGPWAAAIAMILAATSLTALAQFRPGRIDHHNAQILCTVAGLIFLARSLTDRRAGWIAGGALGLGLAIGYEAMALTIPALGVAALLALWRPDGETGVARAAVAATVVLAAALVLTVPPTRWLDIRCDALSLNLVALAAPTAAGLCLALVLPMRRAFRFATTVCGVAAGAMLYASLEPACLAGPFGQVNAALKPIWLDHVLETKSIFFVAADHPGHALGLMAFVFAGAGAQALLWHQRRDVGSALMACIMVLAAVGGCWQVKLMPYAAWLAVLPLGVVAAGLQGTTSLSPLLARIAAVVLLSQTTLDAAFSAALAPFASASKPGAVTAVESADPRRPCFRSASVERLAAMPPGLVAGDIDLGPYMVALTPHRALAAPYHRLGDSILSNHAILDGPFGRARETAQALGVRYIALCADDHTIIDTKPTAPNAQSLRARLLANVPVDFLQEIPLGPGAPMRLWRVGP
jgi:hypothetical protein